MVKKFFFDTYALVEIAKGSQAYLPYKDEVNILLHRMNLLEFVYFLIREGKKSQIAEYLSSLSRFAVEFDDSIIVSAAEMKKEFSKEKLSFVDCLGYQLAKQHKVKFLTGDEKFKHKENVEFVK